MAVILQVHGPCSRYFRTDKSGRKKIKILILYCKEVHNCAAWYLCYSLGKIKPIHRGNRGWKKTAGRRRVMGDRAKAWPLWVNRWLVTFIIPTRAAKWEARQLLSEEFSHVLMSKSKCRLSPLLATRCPVFMTETNVGIPRWHTAAAVKCYIILTI